MPDEQSPSHGRERARELLELGAHRELDDAEQDELIRLLHDHPGVEYDDFTAELGSLSSLGRLDDALPSPALRERITTATGFDTAPPMQPRRWSRPLLAAAAVALIALGAAGNAVVGTLLEDEPPSGPPGTLGVVEAIDFTGEPSGVEVDASVVAHTWGTETRIDVDGLPEGETFTVVVLGSDGAEFASGTFIGSAVPVRCAMNAAVLRTDVATVEIRDAAGHIVMSSDLSPAAA
ncbi:hypothetical protein AB1046_02240 [Promicromonospora sp. Populi]|uniref:hypothetical protein n=1 Tax=Promicromonospora sp. Populi TaxID=3239420 RepID=UPI0034E2E933